MGICQNIGHSREPTKGRQHQVYSLHLNCSTWERESHGLYDYESNSVVKTTLTISGCSAGVLRQDKKVFLSTDPHPAKDAENAESWVLNIKYDEENGDFGILPNDKWHYDGNSDRNEAEKEDNVDNGVWMVVKSMPGNETIKGHAIQEGDCLKLGRIKFRVRALRTEKTGANQPKPTLKMQNISGQGKQVDVGMAEQLQQLGGKKEENNDNSSAKSIVTCRICLADIADDENPFISPCLCSGTMKYVHVKCLQYWLSSKLISKQGNCVVSIIWKSFECELCKNPFPSVFKANGKNYDAVDIPVPTSNSYLVLELVNKDKSQPKGYHIIDLTAKPQIRMGRGHDNDIRVTDISVSRCHASLILDKGQVFLTDTKSKFGTLVLMKEPLVIKRDSTSEHPIIQVGRTVFEFSMKKSWRLLPLCYSGEADVVNSQNLANGLENRPSTDVNHDGSHMAVIQQRTQALEMQNVGSDDPEDGYLHRLEGGGFGAQQSDSRRNSVVGNDVAFNQPPRNDENMRDFYNTHYQDMHGLPNQVEDEVQGHQ